MLKTVFIGAGRRAQSAHYPTVSRIENSKISAVSELNESRMGEVVDKYNIPETFGDYHEMVESVDPDIVYVIMGQEYMTQIAIDCMNAGKHIFIEKPAGGNPAESRQLLQAAESNNVICAVGYQRRFAAVTKETMRLLKEKGGPTLVVGEFHKDLLGTPKPPRTTMWDDICHVVDLIRFVAGSEVIDTKAFQDTNGSDWPNDYTALMRFKNGTNGVLLANRSSGGRTLRAEAHGIGIGCYIQIPNQIEILESAKEARTVHGSNLFEDAIEDTHAYDGTLEMHKHVTESIINGQTPINDIRDVIHTSELVALLEGNSAGE